MGKEVLVRFNANAGDWRLSIYRNITVGAVYPAYLPEEGDRDKAGVGVLYTDELWIHADDSGEGVVGQLSDGFEIVE